jgi:hypothetical protein
VAVLAPNDIWAVGYAGSCFSCVGNTLILHWNGTAWSIVPSPNMGGSTNNLYAVGAITANDIWAAGDYFNGSIFQTLLLHWNGTAWSIVPSPNVSGVSNNMWEVAAIASNDVWAVGDAGRTLALHWDGIGWSLASTPNPGAGPDLFYGADAVTSTDVWAVGTTGSQTLVERYHDPCATPTNTPTATPTPRLLVGHVTWQGPPPQPDARQQLPITLTLKLGTTEVNYPSQNTNASGYFTVSVSGLTAGTYEWRAKGPKYLAAGGNVVLVNSPLTNLEIGLMLTGDCTDDNVVSLPDFSILKRSFGLGQPDPGYDARADLDNNNFVSTIDFNLLRSNFGLGGVPPIVPVGP